MLHATKNRTKQECIPVGCVPPAAVVVGGEGLVLIPLNFPLGCGPESDPPEFPPWVWAWIWSPSISQLGCGPGSDPPQFPPLGCGPGGGGAFWCVGLLVWWPSVMCLLLWWPSGVEPSGVVSFLVFKAFPVTCMSWIPQIHLLYNSRQPLGNQHGSWVPLPPYFSSSGGTNACNTGCGTHALWTSELLRPGLRLHSLKDFGKMHLQIACCIRRLHRSLTCWLLHNDIHFRHTVFPALPN